MRALSADQAAVLALSQRSTHLKVTIDPGGGAQDMRTLQGWDWIEGVEIAEHVDQVVKTATIKLRRSRDSLNLSPLDDNSLLNQSGALADLGTAIVVYTATTALDSLPTSGDWVEIFRGTCDETNFDSDPLVLHATDAGAALQRAYIQTQQKYPADPSTSADVEDIMQALLDDWGGGVKLWSVNGDGTPEFDAGDSPGWVISEYIQQRVHLMDALQLLANQIGWDLRYRWQATAGAFKLVLSEPNRGASSADYTFGDTTIFAPQRAQLSLANIRNKVRVTYGVGAGRTTYTAQDAASIAKYGELFMDLAEDSASQIDSAGEAQTFAEAIRDDLKEPSLEWSVPVLYFWPAEIGDYYKFTAGKFFSSDQTLGVIGVRHTFAQKSNRTILDCRGKPAGGFARWIGLEARLGYNPAVDKYTDKAPSNAAADADVGVIIITYDDPRSMSPPILDWATTKCHVSTTNGFTPSDANLKAIGRQTRFEIGGLVPGTTYYAKIVIVDARGNESTISTQISAAALRSGPYHENNEREYGICNPNPNFSVFSRDRTTSPPDHWEVETGSWGDNANTLEIYFATTPVLTAGKSLKFLSDNRTGTHNKRIMSELFVVRPGSIYKLEWAWREDATNSNKVRANCKVYFYKSDGSAASTASAPPTATGAESWLFNTVGFQWSSVFTATANTWYKDYGWVETPADAAYAKIEWEYLYDYTAFGSVGHPNFYLDGLAMMRSFVKLVLAPASSTRTINATTWTRPWLAASSLIDPVGGWLQGNGGIPVEHQYTVAIAGRYSVWGKVGLQSLTAGKNLIAKIQKNGADLVVGQIAPKTAMNNPEAFVGGVFDLASGDALDLWAQHDDGAAKTLDDSSCDFAVFQIGDET